MERESDSEEIVDDRPGLAPGLQLLLSVVLLIHFGLIGITILAEPSGPWPSISGEGFGLTEPPAFLSEGMIQTARDYAFAVRLGETGRFPSNRLQPQQVQLEAMLYDESGKEIGTRKLPDPSTAPWNRVREQFIAQALANDIMKLNPGNEPIYPAGQEPPKVPVWRTKQGETIQQLSQVPPHLLTRPPDPPDWGPSDWGLELSRSYALHLCRQTGAAAVEIRRHWRNQPAPFLISSDNRPLERREWDMPFGERISSYGKVSDADRK